MMIKDSINIDKVLKYKHKETILRFMDSYDVSMEEATDIFKEMKLLLCLMAEYPDENIFTHEPLWIIDEMWHTFLMYSKDYEDFCFQYFGRMIYHAPVKRAQKMEMQEKLKTHKEETEEALRPVIKRFYNLIFDYLGKETLVKWMKGYGEKYTLEYVNKIRKAIE